MKMKKLHAGVVSAAALIGVLATVGCGSSRPSTYQVTGTVTYEGDPVEGATVSFASTDPETRGAMGVTDSQGQYELTTFEKADGALPGEFKVRVFKYDREPEEVEMSDGPPDQIIEDMPDDYEPEAYEEAEPAQHLLPEEYASPASTPLSFTVEASDENVYDIDLE